MARHGQPELTDSIDSRIGSVIQAASMATLPKKLKHDAIVEAVLEIQFEHTEVPELLAGKLAADSAWISYQSERLPLADFPAALREQESNFRYQPLFQLVRPEPGEIIKIGPRVISLHCLKPYSGWSTFSARLADMVAALFRSCNAPTIHRVGLRYINALTAIHGMRSLWDFNLEILVGGATPAEDVMTAFKFNADDRHAGQVMIASPGYVVSGGSPDAIAYVDLDIYSPTAPGTTDQNSLLQWFESAHEVEKKSFFSLWKNEILTPLTEE